MKRLVFLALLSSGILAACMPHLLKPNPLSKSWKFQYMSKGEVVYEHDPNIMLDSIKRRFELGYLSLYDDHRYTFFGKYISSLGRWHFEPMDSLITIDSFVD